MERSPVETVNTEPLRLTSLRSDADLIAAARSGDAEAYGVLYQRHSAAADRLARQIVKHPADVDDVVAETFARVLHALKRGLGPAQAFRPYLLTAVRRVAIDLLRGQRKQIPTEEADLPDPGEPFSDPVIADLDRSIVARAFTSLPERWSAVLWHTEVEESKPAEVAELLGISANGVSALSYRAREGLKQAYLQLHMSDHTDANCKPIATKLGGYVRGRLSRRTSREVEKHLRNCAECTAAYADLSAINHSLRGALAPVMLGSGAAGYLAAAHSAAASAAAATKAGVVSATALGHGSASLATAGQAAAAEPAAAADHVTAGHVAASHGAAVPGSEVAVVGHDAAVAGHGAALPAATSHVSALRSAGWQLSTRTAAASRRFGRLMAHRPAVPITGAALAAASLTLPLWHLTHPALSHPGSAPYGVSRSSNPHGGHGSGGHGSAGQPGDPRTGSGPVPSGSPSPSASSGHPGSPGGPKGKPSVSPSSSKHPQPSKSPTNSASPHPSSSTSSSPTAPPSSPSTPKPSPTQTQHSIAATAQLGVNVNVNSLLNLGVTALVSVGVSDPGNAATSGLTTNISLPVGVSLLGLSNSSGWSCSGLSCTHAAISAGTTANLSFKVLVVTLSGCGNSVLATATSGSLSASGSSPEVNCSAPLLGLTNVLPQVLKP
jgi:RNA polymerase sigma factor (sigma-70 family)